MMLKQSISIKKDVPYPFMYLPWYHSRMMQNNIFFLPNKLVHAGMYLGQHVSVKLDQIFYL